MPATLRDRSTRRATETSRPSSSGAITTDRRTARLLAAAAIVLLGIGLPLVSAIASGALDVPKGDEGAYARIALGWADGGGLELRGWGEMMLVGHVAWGALFAAAFGTTVPVLMISAAAASALALVLTGVLAARGATWRAYAAMGALAAAPLFAINAISFMTDITALTGSLACLALGVAAWSRSGRQRHLLLATSLLVGLAAFTSREVAIAAPLAVVATLALAPAVGVPLRTVVALATGVVGAAGLLYVWRHGLPGQQEYVVEVATGSVSQGTAVVQLYFTAALIAAPALVLALRPLSRDRWALAAAGATAMVGLLLLAKQLASGDELRLLSPQLIGNGAAWPEIVSVLFNLGILLAGIALSAWLAGAMRSLGRWRAFAPHEVTLTVFAILAALPVALRVAAGAQSFARYALPVGAALTIMILWSARPPSRERLAAFCVVIAGLVGLSAGVILDRDERFAAEWELAEEWRDRGHDALTIDGGLGWISYHYRGIPRNLAPATGPSAGGWAPRAFPNSDDCLVVTDAPRSPRGYEQVDERTYTILPGWQAAAYMHRRTGGCPG